MAEILNKLVGKAYFERQFRRFHKLFMRNQVLDPLKDAVDSKVDLKEGYDLSKNDFTDELNAKLNNLELYNDEEIKLSNKTNRRAIAKLNGDIDTEGSVLNTIENRVQEVLNGAPEDFDTIKEISDWIDEHDGNASDMLEDINKNASDLAALQERWNNYTVIGAEDEDIDFTNSAEFYVADWIHVVPKSLKFTGDGLLTDDPNDYTVDLIQSRITFDDTVYNSEPLTLKLTELELLDFTVSVVYDRSVKSVKVGITGLSAGSDTYTIGKLETVNFELHQWLHLSLDSMFDASALIIDEEEGSRDYSNCTIDKVVLSVEKDADGTIADLSEDEYSLNELTTLGLGINVTTGTGVKDGNYVVESRVTVSGTSVCSSNAFIAEEQSKTFMDYDYAYYTASATDLGGVARSNAIKWSNE